MPGEIIIRVVDGPDDSIGLEVAVSGDLSTGEAIGFMEMAKLQHLDSKRTVDLVAYVEQSPS